MPASSDEKAEPGVVLLVGVVTGVTCARTGFKVSIVKEYTDRLSLVLLALSVTEILQLL